MRQEEEVSDGAAEKENAHDAQSASDKEMPVQPEDISDGDTMADTLEPVVAADPRGDATGCLSHSPVTAGLLGGAVNVWRIPKKP